MQTTLSHNYFQPTHSEQFLLISMDLYKGRWINKFLKSHSFAEVKNLKIFFEGTNKSIPMQETNLNLICVTVNNSPSAASPVHSTHRHCFVHLGETIRKYQGEMTKVLDKSSW